MNRIAIRPLSRILPARMRGEDPDKIEKENLRLLLLKFIKTLLADN